MIDLKYNKKDCMKYYTHKIDGSDFLRVFGPDSLEPYCCKALSWPELFLRFGPAFNLVRLNFLLNKNIEIIISDVYTNTVFWIIDCIDAL